MLWYLIFTVVILNGNVPRTSTDFVAYGTLADCQRARDKINNSPDNSTFAECFYNKKHQSTQF